MFEPRWIKQEVSEANDVSTSVTRDILEVRSSICNTYLVVSSFIAIPLLILSLLRIYNIGWQPVMAMHIIIGVGFVLVTIFRNKISYTNKAVFILVSLLVIGIGGIYQFGMVAGSIAFILAATPVATLLFGGRTAMIVLFLCMASASVLAYLIVSGHLQNDLNLEAYVISPLNWLGKLIAWFFVSVAISASIHVFNGKLIRSLKSAEQHQQDLKLHQANLEKIIEERTSDLLESNQNLERFARIAAHDIKSPLNAIAAHAQLLKMDSDNSLEKELREHIQDILDSTYLVSTMIDDLLEYSKLDKESSISCLVDMNDAFETTLRQLVSEITESGIKISHDTLPVIEAVEVQVIRVMQNIMANAIKYRDRDKISSIHVSAEPQGNMWKFSIKDNGIGISKEQTESIFDIFHQVDSSGTYEGSGIGLASCKKIIERHGGKLWVESEPGNGSIFYFTLTAKNVART